MAIIPKVTIKDVIGLTVVLDTPTGVLDALDFVENGTAIPTGYTTPVPKFSLTPTIARVGANNKLAAYDASNLTNLPVGTGTVAFTTTTGYVSDAYGNDTTAVINDSTKPYKTLQAAYNALPAGGGNLLIDIGNYAKLTTINKGYVRFIGSGRPVTDATITQTNFTTVTYGVATKLINGTVIKGGMNFFDLNGIQLYNLGIDNGSEYVSLGGTEFNALGFAKAINNEAQNTPSPSYTLLKGIVVSNVALLCKDSVSLYHSIVAEDCDGIIVENVKARYGTHGFAIKTTNGIFRNIESADNASDNLIVKSNNYSVASNNLIDGFNFRNAGTSIIFQNKSAAIMKGCRVTNGFVKDCGTGISTADDLGYGFSDINTFGIDFKNCTTPLANNTNYKYWGNVNGVFGQNYVSGAATVIAPPSSGTWTNINYTTANNIQNVGANVWKSITNNNGYGNTGLGATSLPASTDGAIRFFYNGAGSEGSFIGFYNANAAIGYISMQVAFNIISGNIQTFESNNPTVIGGAIVGNFYRIARTGSTYTLDTSTDGTTWTLVRTFGYTGTLQMYSVTDIYGDNSQYSLFHPEKNF